MPNRRKVLLNPNLMVCAKCGLEKPLEFFGKRKNRALGYTSWCRACLSKKVMAGRDKTKHAIDRAAHRKRRPDLARATAQRYYATHPDQALMQAQRIKRWVQENPELAKRSKDNWIAANSSKRRIYTGNRRAREAKNGGQLSVNIEKLLFIEQGGKCPYCDGYLSQTGFHLDHYMPISLGGKNEDQNIQLLCPPCNRKKHKKHPTEFFLKVWYNAYLGKDSESSSGPTRDMDRSDH
jgi:5-methylcytosine-specific restriction endonuclease McrA